MPTQPEPGVGGWGFSLTLYGGDGALDEERSEDEAE